MIFSELYSSYYNAVAAILKAACDHPLQKDELRALIREEDWRQMNIEALCDVFQLTDEERALYFGAIDAGQEGKKP